MKVCICGGGNIGHVVAGYIAAQDKHEVRLLTRHPERWQQTIVVETPDRGSLHGKVDGIYADAAIALDGADIVLLCLPGFALHEMLMEMKDCLPPQTAVGSVVSSTGFFFEAMQLLPQDTPLFGFQRVPFISRTIEYGRRARLMGYKESLSMAVERCDNPEALRRSMEQLLATPVHLLNSYYEVSLSNSNPLLHPARLYSLWNEWNTDVVYPRIPLFYEEWTVEAAELYIVMDQELQQLLDCLPVGKGSIPTVLDYYECTDAVSLAEKLRSIEAFKGIVAPMKAVGGGFIPDFQSRYFVEDFPYGLSIVERLARKNSIATPIISKVCQWGMSVINQKSA